MFVHSALVPKECKFIAPLTPMQQFLIALFFPILEQLCGKPNLKRVNLKLRSLANHESIGTQLKKITLTFSRKLLNVKKSDK